MQVGAVHVRAGVTLASALVLIFTSVALSAVVQADTTRANRATVSVLHALPSGAPVVDVYANESRIIDSLKPGQLRTVKVSSGRYEIVVVPDGEGLDGQPALLSMPRADIATGANVTFTANLDDSGEPELNMFSNKTRTVGQGMGRLTVRHIANAPAIDIRSRGLSVFESVENANSVDTGLNAGTYSVRMSETGDRQPLLARTEVKIRNKPGRSDMGNNVIVYLWGDAGRIRTAVQEVQLDLN